MKAVLRFLHTRKTFSEESMANILVIPHYPGFEIRTRAWEMTRALARGFPNDRLFFLAWPLKAPGENARHYQARALGTRLGVAGQQAGVTLVTMPAWFSYRLPLAGFNARALARLIERFAIDTVINSAFFFFPFPLKSRAAYVYDLVDFPQGEGSKLEEARTLGFMRREAAKAARVITITGTIRRLLKERWGIEAIVIPNGMHLDELLAEDPIRGSQLRKKLGLEEARIIGYPGNHASWSGLDFLLEAFRQLRASSAGANRRVALLVIGPGSEVNRLRNMVEGDPDIVFTGPCPPNEMPAYFSIMDIGVLPFEKSIYTDCSLPIKVLEYGAFHLPVVATPLEELKNLALPYVDLVEREPPAWVDAMQKALKRKWNPDWNRSLTPFDWNSIAGALHSLLP